MARSSQSTIGAFIFTFGLLSVAVVLGFIVLGRGGGETTYTQASNGNSSDEFGEYQAVFLNNGQVYFGRITQSTEYEIHLSNAYYLQVNDQIETEAGTTDADLSLIKRTETLHSPEPLMIFNRDHVIFIENLDEDSQVVDAIEQDS